MQGSKLYKASCHSGSCAFSVHHPLFLKTYEAKADIMGSNPAPPPLWTTC